MSDVRLIEQLKQDLEYATKEALEWWVLADLFEECDNIATANGLRRWVETYHEPLCDGDRSRRRTTDDLKEWNRYNFWKNVIEKGNRGIWRWQAEPTWADDPNFVGPTIFEGLSFGMVYERWKVYDTRVAAVLDYAWAWGFTYNLRKS